MRKKGKIELQIKATELLNENNQDLLMKDHLEETSYHFENGTTCCFMGIHDIFCPFLSIRFAQSASLFLHLHRLCQSPMVGQEAD
jgi:hypothetical protein